MRNSAVASALLLAATSLLSCGKGTPVAPTGAIMRVSVIPDRISAFGVANVTVELLRPNGNPVNAGTEVRLTSNIGAIDEVVLTDESGIARSKLRGDGRVGTAKISVSSGAGSPVAVEVKVGSFPASISLQATPTTVPESGGTVDLLALVRDDQGQPLSGANVNFSAAAGTLQSGGAFIVTNTLGEARDLLEVSAADLQTVSGNTFTVKVEAGTGTGSLMSQTFSLGIQRKPRAAFTFNRNGLIVVFTDTSTGNPTDWSWDFGDGTPRSTAQNPTHSYSAAGTYVVTLTASNASGSSTASQVVAVTGN